MKVKIIERWKDEDGATQNLNTKESLPKSIILELKNFNVEFFDELMELRQLIKLRNSDEGYSSKGNQSLEQELKEQKWLRKEGVTLENSPVEYLQNRYDYLEQAKFFLLEYELCEGRINQREFDLEIQLLNIEMDKIESIIIERTKYSQQNESAFPLIGVVFESEIIENFSYADKIFKLRCLFEIYYRRQRQIDQFNLYKEYLKESRIKPNGDWN
jgi:hypothetical protein